MYCQSSKATLILLIYNDGAIYFGADSQVTGGSSNTFLRSKIFTLDKTSCVAIVGCCGGNVEEMSGKQSFMLLPNVLKSACDETNEPTMSLQNKITRVVSKLDTSHRIYMLTKTVANYNKTADTKLPIQWDFYSQDMTKLTITFFGQWYQLVETNRAALDILLKRGQTTKGSPINAERAAEPTQQFFMGKKTHRFATNGFSSNFKGHQVARKSEVTSRREFREQFAPLDMEAGIDRQGQAEANWPGENKL